MLAFIKGDLTTIKKGIICHQVNCQGKMGAGLAKALSDKYTIIKKRYLQCYLQQKENPILLLKTCQIVPVKEELFIANCFAQLYYGRNKNYRYTDYDALKNALSQAVDFAKTKDLPIYVPKYIGCRLANGNWNIVLNILKMLSEEINYPIIVVEKE